MKQPKAHQAVRSYTKHSSKRTKCDNKIEYGTFTGELMSSLPARYLFHLWTNGQFQERNRPESKVHQYIVANTQQLNKEHPSKDWSLE